MSTEAPSKPTAEKPPPTEKPSPDPVEEQKEILDSIVPNKEAKVWTFGKGNDEMVYTQRPMSYFGKMEWFSLLAQEIDKMSENGASVSEMLTQVGVTGGALTVSDFSTADSFLKTVAKVVTDLPEFLEESYCMWLGVPRGDREYVKSVMRLPEEDGGLSDDMGFEILERFLDQNVGAIESFFVERLPSLGRRARGLMTVAQPKKKARRSRS